MPAPNTTATLRPVPVPEPPSRAAVGSSPVAGSETPIAPPMSAANMSLPELDNTLAADFDQMLQGNFESIDAVLEGVFEKQAVLVQNPEGAAVPIVMPSAESPPAPTLEIANTPPPPTIAVNVAIQETVTSPHIAVERAAEPIPPELEATAAAIVLPSESPPLASSAASPSVIAAPAAPQSSVRRGINVFAALKAVVVRILMVLNYPMRLAPPSLRPVMNWTAITLLAWVPIVWLMVTLSGKADSSAAASPDVESATHTAPLHEESSHGDAHP